MELVRKTLQGWKTYLVGASGIITAIIAYADGGCDLGTLIMTVVGSMLAMTVRAGVQKVQDAVEEE